MALDVTRYQLTQLLQDAWYRMGQIKRWKATSGTTTTVVNSTWAGVEEQLFEDDDPALIYGTMVLLEDAGGLNAAPEGEMGMITDYDSSTNTMTFDAISSAVGVGDKFGIASPLFPLEDMVELANISLQKLGEIDLVDRSLTVLANTTEYSLTPEIINVIRVRVQTLAQTNNNQWTPVQGWSIIPGSPGNNSKLVIPSNLTQGYTLEITYRGFHDKLKTFDSVISETINPELAVCSLLAEAYQWYNNQVGGSNQYFLQRENKALQDLEAALVKHPIRRLADQVAGMPHWKKSGDYIPLTSDLRA